MTLRKPQAMGFNSCQVGLTVSQADLIWGPPDPDYATTVRYVISALRAVTVRGKQCTARPEGLWSKARRVSRNARVQSISFCLQTTKVKRTCQNPHQRRPSHPANSQKPSNCCTQRGSRSAYSKNRNKLGIK